MLLTIQFSYLFYSLLEKGSQKVVQFQNHLLYAGKAQRGIVYAASSAPQWPNNVVPYLLDGAFKSADRAIIAAVSTFILGCHG
jgi:hypothetical protein